MNGLAYLGAIVLAPTVCVCLGYGLCCAVAAAIRKITRDGDIEAQLPTEDDPGSATVDETLDRANRTSDAWLDWIDAHRAVQCHWTGESGCRDCGWLTIFGRIVERQLIRVAPRHRPGCTGSPS